MSKVAAQADALVESLTDRDPLADAHEIAEAEATIAALSPADDNDRMALDEAGEFIGMYPTP